MKRIIHIFMGIFLGLSGISKPQNTYTQRAKDWASRLDQYGLGIYGTNRLSTLAHELGHYVTSAAA